MIFVGAFEAHRYLSYSCRSSLLLNFVYRRLCFLLVSHTNTSFYSDTFRTLLPLFSLWEYIVLVIITDLVCLGKEMSRTDGQENRDDDGDSVSSVTDIIPRAFLILFHFILTTNLMEIALLFPVYLHREIVTLRTHEIWSRSRTKIWTQTWVNCTCILWGWWGGPVLAGLPSHPLPRGVLDSCGFWRACREMCLGCFMEVQRLKNLLTVLSCGSIGEAELQFWPLVWGTVIVTDNRWMPALFIDIFQEGNLLIIGLCSFLEPSWVHTQL